MAQPPSSATIHFVKGRGAGSNARSRFEEWTRELNLEHIEESRVEAESEQEDAKVDTDIQLVQARSIISYNTSPDIPFDQSKNPYQGCEHGCIYCYARPSHAYIGLSPGVDFETKIFAKSNAPELLTRELSSKSYEPGLIALGANTDPYQPAEREHQLTRRLLEILSDCNVPVGITTKSALVTRDIDILQSMAQRNLVRVHISLATVTPTLARILDPRANAPFKRLEAMEKLAVAGIPVSVFASPMVPAVNDKELEKILEAAKNSGASFASMIILRLPREVEDLFSEWLEKHFPLRKEHVFSLLRQMRDGRVNDPNFGSRMRGQGVYADIMAQRFKLACRRFGLKRNEREMDLSLFRRPSVDKTQFSLF